MAKDYQGPVRIKDIAKKAGVSIGTVDRVIHRRGKVSSKNERKVNDAIASLEYEPNIMARSLAMNASFQIAIIIPKYAEDSFWMAQLEGIELALKYIKDFGFSITLLEFDDQLHGDLLRHIDSIRENKFDAVLIAPTITDDAHKFLDITSELEIPYLLVNTFLERDDESFIGYVGQNSYQSGQLAAKLLSLVTNNTGDLAIFHMEKEVENSEHMMQKEKGFNEFFKSSTQFENEIIVDKMPGYTKDAELINPLDNFLKKHKNIKGIFVTTSRLHFITEALIELKREDISVVGFDLIKENIAALEKYEKMLLINQNPGMQGQVGLMTLFDHLLKKKRIVEKQYLPLDVITKENLSTYLGSTNFREVI